MPTVQIRFAVIAAARRFRLAVRDDFVKRLSKHACTDFDRALYPGFPMFFEPERSYIKRGFQELCKVLNFCWLGARR
jgi:RNase P protein component